MDFDVFMFCFVKSCVLFSFGVGIACFGWGGFVSLMWLCTLVGLIAFCFGCCWVCVVVSGGCFAWALLWVRLVFALVESGFVVWVLW